MGLCDITSGNIIGCKNNRGGIQKVFIGNFSGDTTYTVDGDEKITGITSGATYFTFNQRIQTAGFEEVIQPSTENGTLFYEQSVSLTFDKNTAALRNQLYLLAQAQLTVIVLDQNGIYTLVGQVNGADVSEGTIPRGTALGDRNGTLLTIFAAEPTPAREISLTAFQTLTVN